MEDTNTLKLSLILEAPPVKSWAGLLNKAIKNDLDALKLRTTDGVLLRNGEEIANALKMPGKLGDVAVGTIRAKLLRSPSLVYGSKLRLQLIDDFASTPGVLQKWGRYEEPAIKDGLKKLGYADDVAGDMAKSIKTKSGGVTNPTNVVNPGKPNIHPMNPDEVKKTFFQKYGKKMILGGGIAGLAKIGTIGGLLYWIMNGRPDPELIKDVEKTGYVLGNAPDCIKRIMTKYNVENVEMINNVPAIRVTTFGNIDGGVIIYMDTQNGGRIQKIKTGEVGKWNCSTMKENKRLSLLNIILEQGTPSNEVTPQQMAEYVDNAVKYLDGWVAVGDLSNLKNIITSLKGKTYKTKDALNAFLGYYKRDEGTDFLADLNGVGLRSLGVPGMELKDEIEALLTSNVAGGGTDNEGMNISFGGDTNQPQQPQQPQPSQPQQGQPEQQQPQQGQIKYRRCEGTYTIGCYSRQIGKVQRCIENMYGRTPRGNGYYDPATKQKLDAIGYPNGFTDADVEKICAMASQRQQGQTNEVSEVGKEEEKIETPRMTYEKYFDHFDAKQKHRVKLSVDNLPTKDLSNLNEYFKTQNYYKLKDPMKKYGVKYVWKLKDDK